MNKVTRLEFLLPAMEQTLERGNNVIFSPNGTSMLPMLRSGKDQVVLSPIKGKLRKYDLPLYRRDNGQFVLHRIVAVGETYTCCGDNQLSCETGIRPDQLIAVVTAFTRKGAEHCVTDWDYKLYCRFWVASRPIRRVYYSLKRRLKKLLSR